MSSIANSARQRRTTPPSIRHCPDDDKPAPLPVAALVATTLLPGGAMLGLVLAAPHPYEAPAVLLEPYVWRVVRFTLWQAGLSTLLSLFCGVLLGRALFRRGAFAGRGTLLRLLLLPFALPQLIAVLGLLSVWGHGGLGGWIGRSIGREMDIYGLAGILMAHVFFNMPLVARLTLARLQAAPAEYWRLAMQLRMPPFALWRLVEWPLIRAVLPGAALLVFMLCAGSFTVVLVLGGGPAATTLEVAIYQSLRFDFAPARAVVLALLQLALTTSLFFVLRRLAPPPAIGGGIVGEVRHPHAEHRRARLVDHAIILTATLYLAAPLIGIVVAGLRADLARLLTAQATIRAIATSLGVSFVAGVMATGAAWSLTLLSRRRRGGVRGGALPQMADGIASLVLVVPPVMLAAGWFVLLVKAGMTKGAAPWVVAAINAFMTLPFAWRSLQPAAREGEARHGRLCAQLGLRGWARLRLVDWPVLRRPLGLALAMSLALSLGDLGAIALFGSEDFRTLPFLVYQRLGSYRTEDAAGLALLLLLMVAALVFVAERLGDPAAFLSLREDRRR